MTIETQHPIHNTNPQFKSGNRAIRALEEMTPVLGTSVYVDPSAVVIGQVQLADDVSVWPLAVIRGDMMMIEIGARSNVQDGCVLHITHAGPNTGEGYALKIGNDVTVGHKVILHGCTIEDRVLVGMGSIILDGVIVESDTIIGAGSLVPSGQHLVGGFLYFGTPIKQVRALKPSELDFLCYSAHHYVDLKNRYLAHQKV